MLRNKCAVKCAARSLLVVLDRVRGAQRGVVRVLPGGAARATLAQQVPALVELDLDLLHARVKGLVEAVVGLRAVQELVLLLHQRFDVVGDLLVSHAFNPVTRGMRSASARRPWSTSACRATAPGRRRTCGRRRSPNCRSR